jgi:CDP-diacylglycerol pyrophosphatase
MKAELTFRAVAFRAFPAGAAICVCAAFLLLAGEAAQRGVSRTALWEVVHNVCVPGQTQYHDPTPCLRVDLKGGAGKGFAVLKDPRGSAQFLLVPTAQISGIESPDIREPGGTNYFASAWESRAYINEELRRTLPRDAIGMAINSASSRSQDQLHIHVACVRANVLEALRKNQSSMGEEWAPLGVPLFGHHYMAMWVPGENLGSNNPFRILAGTAGALQNMGNHTLAVVGLTRADGTKGFVLLADQVNKTTGDRANGEELLDHACRIAANPTLGN